MALFAGAGGGIRWRACVVFVLVGLALWMCCGCRTVTGTTAAFTPQEDGSYEAVISGPGVATYEKDGVKASIDTKKRSIFSELLQFVLFRGVDRAGR